MPLQQQTCLGRMTTPRVVYTTFNPYVTSLACRLWLCVSPRPFSLFLCSERILQSTFTASLIVSWVSYVSSIPTSHEHVFNIGLFISFFALGLQFGNIVVAGRGAAIASQCAADPNDTDDTIYSPRYFRHYLELSEQLHFLATITFMVAVITMTFLTFHSIVYPTVLVGVYTVLAVIVFWSAYWKVSMTLRNLKLMIKGVHLLRTRAKSYQKRSKHMSS